MRVKRHFQADSLLENIASMKRTWERSRDCLKEYLKQTNHNYVRRKLELQLPRKSLIKGKSDING